MKRDLQWLRRLSEDAWVWCLHCERAFQIKDIKWVPAQGSLWSDRLEIACCAYEGCDGTLLDFQSYQGTRQDWWPAVPVKGERYPLYR